MKKSQRLRFIDLARRQDNLSDAETAELAELHKLACLHNDPSKDIDDLPKKAAQAVAAVAKDAVTRAEFEALKARVAKCEAAIAKREEPGAPASPETAKK